MIDDGIAILPDFDELGLLPSGDFPLTFNELRDSPLVLGPMNKKLYPNWDSSWRRRLANHLEMLVQQLWRVGISEIFINGSFTEDKEHPNDIDGYFECDLIRLASGDLQRELNLIDPFKVWTWDPPARRPHPQSPKKQLPMWHVYRVDLYPHCGQPSGIKDRFGQELEFPSAFRQCRATGRRKGIIKVIKQPNMDQPTPTGE